MIKINISEKKMEEIKDKHWAWFENKYLSKEKSKLKNWFKKTYDVNDKELKKIILGDISILNKYKNKIKNTEAKKNKRMTDLYKNFRKFKKEWNGVDLCLALGIKTCPYCNTSFTYNYSHISEKRTTAELDHFFPKNRYPFFALSLFNLIPACHNCNHIKSEEEGHLYPYKEKFGKDAKFTIKLKNDDESLIDKVDFKLKKEYDSDVFYGNSDNFIIDFDIKNSDKKDKIIKSINTFKLKKVYQYHKDYVRELIKKAIMYNESRIDELYQEYEGVLFSSREDVINTVVSNYIDDENMDKRVLAKLTRDICEELGIGS